MCKGTACRALTKHNLYIIAGFINRHSKLVSDHEVAAKSFMAKLIYKPVFIRHLDPEINSG